MNKFKMKKNRKTKNRFLRFFSEFFYKSSKKKYKATYLGPNKYGLDYIDDGLQEYVQDFGKASRAFPKKVVAQGECHLTFIKILYDHLKQKLFFKYLLLKKESLTGMKYNICFKIVKLGDCECCIFV